ncbi:MAG: hypothetical protein K8W52_39005 [Deltaproteobacteria bacterium]|nr:hypothetical protein [Deltaproteobacteria bacterium]
MEISGERHIEMTWRCSACQHQNLGRHKVCQACANPKDGSEEYEMPANPERAASVTDAELMRMATAGPDWRCAYCGSDQRRLDASCATCGASIAAAEPEPEAAPEVAVHYDAVVDHYEPERYSVEVADGYRTEHYTARESCGQDCTTRSPTCRQSCSSRRNGFASCRQVCSGGGRSCSTRYCSVPRTRQVAKTRTEWRTRKVPRYRQVPRYAEAFRWTAYAWAPERTAREAGTDAANVRWPAGARTTSLPPGEQERERRRATYTVTLRFDDDSTVRFEVASPEALRRFATGSRHDLHWETDALRVDGMPIRPL